MRRSKSEQMKADGSEPGQKRAFQLQRWCSSV
jgi:hypothetical protein